jgi:heterodisulfide reductase subunit B
MLNPNLGPELNYSLFLGCVIPNRYPMIERATRTVLHELHIKIFEMDGASCCPAPGVFKSIDRVMWLTLAARNLSIAEKTKTDVLTLCNLCYSTLMEVEQKIHGDRALKIKIQEILEKSGIIFKGTSRVRHIVDILYFDVGLPHLKQMMKLHLGLKVAVHYGCHLVKPSDLRPFGGECEHPRFFDDIVEITGCKSLDYPFKMQCCGAGGGIRTTMKKVSLDFLLEKLRAIKSVDADCIVVCCPFCFLQFDLGQIEARDLLQKDEEPFNIPVLYITQLLGLAMGIEPLRLGLIKPELIAGVSPFIEHGQLLAKIEKNNTLKDSTNG